jgi:NADPH:quinone reductase-like Zn-dependent oxidoreductase
LSAFGSRKFRGVFANVNEKDLTALADLVVSGNITPVIEHRYPLAEAPEAIRYVESTHARGKVIITL